MAKVYLPSFAICTLSFTLNLLVLGIYPFRVIALDSPSKNDNRETSQQVSATIEAKILLEINRVRTNPKDYANWLQSQKQYYDGVWLKLPGEQPVRTNKGLKALEEAIAFLREQQPLSPLSPSDLAVADASSKLEDFATTSNIQNISYGRVTPRGIVMSWVVDELFPDRRRRINLLDPDFKNTGVICQNDPRYQKVCAISYTDSTSETIATEPKTPVKTETETAITEPETPVKTETETAITEPEIIESTETKPETTTETLPQPPEIPPTPPTVENSNDKGEETVIADNNHDLKQEEIEENEEIEPEEVAEDLETEPLEDETDVAEEAEANTENESEDLEIVEDKEEVFEPKEKPEEQQEIIATNSDNSRLLENVERGALEEGDRVIPEDGSFYDSFPIEGKSGESFTISLESEEFDPFVALIDSKGNIIEQNDDINEENSNSRIRVTIPEDGVYNVIVNAYDEGGSGKYILTVSR